MIFCVIFFGYYFYFCGTFVSFSSIFIWLSFWNIQVFSSFFKLFCISNNQISEVFCHMKERKYLQCSLLRLSCFHEYGKDLFVKICHLIFFYIWDKSSIICSLLKLKWWILLLWSIALQSNHICCMYFQKFRCISFISVVAVFFCLVVPLMFFDFFYATFWWLICSALPKFLHVVFYGIVPYSVFALWCSHQ